MKTPPPGTASLVYYFVDSENEQSDLLVKERREARRSILWT